MQQLSQLFWGLKDIEVEHSDDLDSVTTHQHQMPEGDAQLHDDFEPIIQFGTLPDITAPVSSDLDAITPLVPSLILDDKVSCMRCSCHTRSKFK
jgi:hypothetical protein